ncbi:SRPBCC domain-containing protein [Pararhodobacter zhoushanensis]|uniref:SRPBCC domain-containing protein n=1 Tax=Pararhodobacter zhoushanensis TaxID=2479545 RepID=UPI000F8D72FD|nr:SRPBCC domain-containing protein [Pararhodobacter zhoushanensis]
MPLTLDRTSPTVATVTRHFSAPPARVWEAHTDPALLSQWLVGPDGWVMSRCEVDMRPGGSLRYDWQSADGTHGFYMTADVLEVEEPHRILHVERMFLPDQTPDNTVDTRFIADGSGTRMVMTMTVEAAETMDAMLATGMTDGMEASYARLEREHLAA